MAIEGVPVGVDGSAAGTVVGAPDLAGSLTVSEFHQLLDEAVRSAGLVHLWVTGTVTGLRPGPKFTTFELVDYEDDGATVRAVLSVGVFAGFAGEIRKTLAVAGAGLVDGLQDPKWPLPPNSGQM